MWLTMLHHQSEWPKDVPRHIQSEWMMGAIYGMLTDGVRWRFFGLEDDILLDSHTYSMVIPDGVRTLDLLVAAA